MAIEEIEQLRLERGARAVGVEFGEERVLRFLQHDRRVEPCAEPLGQRGFARADRALRSRCSETARRPDDIIAP